MSEQTSEPKTKKEFHVGSFSGALELLKQGKPVYRKIWEEGTFIYLVSGSTFVVSKEPLLSLVGPINMTFSSHIDMYLGSNRATTWSPNLVDILAEDWQSVQEE